MKGQYSDEQLINGLRTMDNHVLTILLKEYYPKIEKYVIKNKGTKQEADDVFQESIKTIFNVVNNKDFRLQKTFDAYFTTLFQNIWISEVKLKNKQDTIDTFPETLEYKETDIYEEIKQEKLRKLANDEYKKLDKEPRTLIELFYFKKKTMAEIAYKMNYKNADSAKTLKCKAVTLLKEKIKNTIIYKKLQND